MLSRRGHTVVLWEYQPDAVERMSKWRENRVFLPGVPFPERLTLEPDIERALAGSSFIILAVPSHALRETLNRLPEGPPPESIVVSALKGLEVGTLKRMSEVFQEVWGDRLVEERLVVLSGPSHAEEVIKGIPTSVVAASRSKDCAQAVQKLLSDTTFRVYTHHDVVGVELGGALKNVIAIAAGIADGLGFGDNTKGALITRGLAEITRLGVKLGGEALTFAGLSGMGDLIATCTSRHSRNRYVGEQIGRGRKLKEILAEMKMVAEGVRTAASAWSLAQREGVEMPITEQVYRILYEGADPKQATWELMNRTLKDELVLS